MQFYAAQGIGLVGMALAFISFQNNDKKKILLIQAAASFTFAVHFILLGAFTGVGMNLLEIPRNLIFARKHEKPRQRILTAVFIAAFIILGVFTRENLFSVLPVVAMCISTAVYSLKNPRSIRFCILPVSVLWLTYNILVLSIAGVLTESFCLISIMIAVFRFDILKK